MKRKPAGSKRKVGMTARQALRFIETHGVALESARGAAPRLTETIINGPVKGSWWGHPRGREIFAVLQAVKESEEVLVCRLLGGKITFVHRRLWPALVRIAPRLEPGRVARVSEIHTAAGRHEITETPFPRWVPADVKAAASRLSEAEAVTAFGRAASALKLAPG